MHLNTTYDFKFTPIGNKSVGKLWLNANNAKDFRRLNSGKQGCGKDINANPVDIILQLITTDIELKLKNKQ